MICVHCRQAFTEDDASEGCTGCGAFGGCHLIKCPHCDYYQPQEPEWIKKLRDIWQKRRSGATSR